MQPPKFNDNLGAIYYLGPFDLYILLQLESFESCHKSDQGEIKSVDGIQLKNGPLKHIYLSS